MEHGWALLLFGTVCLSSLLHVAGSATPVVVTLDKVIPVTTASCKFPFTYDGKSYVACTNANATNPASFWCSVDAVYSTGRWGFCPVTLNKPSLTTTLGTCNFPVDVNGPNGFKVRFFECSNAFEEAASGSAPAGKEMCKSTTNQIISCPTPATGCIDTFVTASNTGLSGGIQAPSSANANTAADCTKYCLSKSFVDCAATDFDASNACYTFKSTQLSGTTRVAAGVTHAVRIQCDATTTTATPTPSVPTCIDTFNKSVNSNQLMGVLQVNVITQAACQADCLALQTCTGFDYTSDNKCWRHISKGTINANKVNVDHYERVACVDVTATTACTDSFTEQLGQQLFTGTAAPAYNNNPAGCQAWCLGQSTCTHYEIDANNACYWHAKPGATPVSNGNNNHKLFTRVPCLVATTVSGVCRDTFTANPNAFKYDGVPVAGNAVDACTSACLARTELCVAFDFDAATKKCFLHGVATQSAPLQAGNGVSHNVRNFECNATSTALACRDPFTKTENRNRAGGVRATGISTQTNCEKECLKTEKSDSNACYGYDFNTQNNECYVHMGSIPSTTGAFPNVNTYERQFLCGLATTVLATGPTGVTGGFACVDNFASSPNSNAYLGVLKAAATTEPACRALCVGTNEGDPKYCFGYDFDGTNSQCWFQERTADYQINVGSAPGVTHYKRTRVCPSTVVTGVVCVESYNATANKNAPGGADVGQQTVDECKALCENRTNCFGFDSANGRCWVHELKDYTLNAGVANGVTNYRRLFNCVGGTTVSGCIPTFTRKENIIVYGGTLAPGANSIDACSSACVAGTDCVGYNYDKTASSSKCYLLTGVVGNENPNNDLDLYTKDDNCALLSTTPVSLCSMNKIGDGNVVGGKAVDNVNTLPACLAFCIRSETCKAVDFDKTVSQCFWFSAGGLKPSGSSCCEHHQKDCRGVCVDSYNVTVNTGYLGGVEVPQRPSVMDCQNACTESAMCEGFDFNKPVPSCFVLTAGSLNPANARPYSSSDVDHYRRNRCPGGTPGRTTLPTTIRTTLCPARYQRNVNRNARGGTRYPPGTSLPACQDGCTKDENCFALDFDRNANSCFFHKAVPTGLGTAPGVDHYVKIPCPGVTPAPVTPAPVTPAPVTPAPVTPAPVTPAPVTPAPVTPAPVTPTPTACNIDIGFILESSTANTAAVASFQRGVMGLVIGRMNFGRTGFRVSTRRFATTSEKFLTVQTADYYNRADIVGIVRGQSVNAPLGQPGKNVDLAVNGFLNGDTSGRAEVADSLVAIPGVTGTRVNLVVLMTDVNPGTAMDTLLPRVRKVIMVPLTSSLIVPPRFNTIRDIQGRVKLVALPLNTDNNTITNSIISEINLINPLCRDQAVTVTPALRCRGDVAILIDDSGSIRDSSTPQSDNWQTLVNFVLSIIDQIDQIEGIAADKTRVGIAKFSTMAEVVHRLTDVQDRTAIRNAIRNMDYSGGITNTIDGLNIVRTQFFNSTAGDRVDQPNVLILITDGRPTTGNDRAFTQALTSIRTVAEVIVIGVTGNADQALLALIEPNPRRRFHVDNFNQLGGVLQQVQISACNAL